MDAVSISLDRVFVAPRPLLARGSARDAADGLTRDDTVLRVSRIARGAAWPLAVLLVIHRVVIVAFNGNTTDDFTTVYSAVRRFIDGVPVYEQAYNHVDPLYLYNPGATLLLAPLGASGNLELMRAAFIVANAVAIIGALAVLTRLMGHRLDGALFPVSIAAAFATEAVTNTLAFSNINGLLLLALSGFLWALVRGLGESSPSQPNRLDAYPERLPEHRRTGLLWLAGIAIGLAIVVKPQFAPLLFLPLVRLEWRPIAAGLAIPLALNAIAWPMVPGAADYFSKLVPYLGITRDYANASLPGMQAYFGFPDAAFYPVWLACALCVAVGVIVLLRWRLTDVTVWATTTSSLLLVGVFLLSSLGQQYYSMWLFPALFTAVLARSVFHSWPAWLAAASFLMPVTWYSSHWPNAGRWLSVCMCTFGWLLLTVTITFTALGWWVSQRPSRPRPEVGTSASPDNL